MCGNGVMITGTATITTKAQEKTPLTLTAPLAASYAVAAGSASPGVAGWRIATATLRPAATSTWACAFRGPVNDVSFTESFFSFYPFFPFGLRIGGRGAGMVFQARSPFLRAHPQC